MPIYGTGSYRIKSEAVGKVKRAIKEFVSYIKKNESGTRLYVVYQEKDDPTRFIHFYIFANAAAEDAHSKSEAVKRFESVYTPALKGGPVTFTDYNLIDMKV